jgi:hypothetical protein
MEHGQMSCVDARIEVRYLKFLLVVVLSVVMFSWGLLETTTGEAFRMARYGMGWLELSKPDYNFILRGWRQRYLFGGLGC